MNADQIAAIKQLIRSIKIEKQDLQAQKIELNETHDTAIANINARIDVINAQILTLKEGIEGE